MTNKQITQKLDTLKLQLPQQQLKKNKNNEFKKNIEESKQTLLYPPITNIIIVK